MKTLLFIGFSTILLMLSTAQAQQTGSVWGATPADSLLCRQQVSNMQSAVQIGDFERALTHFNHAFENCPGASVNIVHFGAVIYRHFFNNETDPVRRQEYLNKVLSLYDVRMELFPDLQRRGEVIIAKTNAYVEMMGDQADQALIHKWLCEAIEDLKSNITVHTAASYWTYMVLSLNRFQTNVDSRETYIASYFRVIGYLEQAKEFTTDENFSNHLTTLIDGITGMFISSGAGDCETIAAFYADRVAANPTDVELLSEVLSVLSQLGCRESELFFIASAHMHAISPTANSALGMGQRAHNEGDNAAAMRYFRQAAELETDNVRASDIILQVARIQSTQRNWAATRSTALEALRLNPNNGSAHILIAQVIASGAAGILPAERTGLVFGLAIDHLERARAVDPSVAAQANNLIQDYTRRLLDRETAFMMGITAGETVHIPGWINSNVTVRLR